MSKPKPQFDDEPLDADDEEGPCPIPDENGDVVLQGKRPKKKRKKSKKPKARRKNVDKRV